MIKMRILFLLAGSVVAVAILSVRAPAAPSAHAARNPASLGCEQLKLDGHYSSHGLNSQRSDDDTSFATVDGQLQVTFTGRDGSSRKQDGYLIKNRSACSLQFKDESGALKEFFNFIEASANGDLIIIGDDASLGAVGWLKRR